MALVHLNIRVPVLSIVRTSAYALLLRRTTSALILIMWTHHWYDSIYESRIIYQFRTLTSDCL